MLREKSGSGRRWRWFCGALSLCGILAMGMAPSPTLAQVARPACVSYDYAGNFGSFSLCQQQILADGAKNMASQLCVLLHKSLKNVFGVSCKSTGVGSFTYKCC
jgi:hypothetical protein